MDEMQWKVTVTATVTLTVSAGDRETATVAAMERVYGPRSPLVDSADVTDVRRAPTVLTSDR